MLHEIKMLLSRRYRRLVEIHNKRMASAFRRDTYRRLEILHELADAEPDLAVRFRMKAELAALRFRLRVAGAI